MEEPHIITRLLAFLDTLPPAFGCGPREQMAIRELALRLIAAGEAPADPAAWKTLLAPLVCGDPAQQQEFYERFDAWISTRTEIPLPLKSATHRWPIAIAATILTASIITAGAYYRSVFRPIPDLHPPPAPPFSGPEPAFTVPANRLEGVVETRNGIPLRYATVWIPRDLASDRKLLTDSRGRFAVALPASGSSAARGPAGEPLVLRVGGVPLSVSFNNDGTRIATNGGNGAEIRDAITGRQVLSVAGHSSVVFAVAFSPDGSTLATASDDRTAKVWNATTGKEILTLRGHTSLLTAVAFSPDGRTLATASDDRTAKVWDTATGKEVLTLRGHTSTVESVAFSPDSRKLATAGYDDTARIWDATTGKVLLTLLGHTGLLHSVAFSPNGRTLATGSWDKTAKIWDVTTGKEILTLRHSGFVNAVAFSPDGRTLATATEDGRAKIWDATTGKEIFSLRGDLVFTEVASVNDVAFSRVGSRLATANGAGAGTVKIWDLSAILPSYNNPEPLLITHPDYEPGYTELAIPGTLSVIKLGPLKSARRVLVFAPNPPPARRRFPRGVSIALALIPVAAALVLFFWLRQRDRGRKAFLEQWETHLDLQPVRVHTRSEEDELFQSIEIADLARELRRRRPEPISQLAVEPTVRQTADRAGLFTPIHRQRRAAREYLVLFETKGERDQQALLWTCLFNRLAALDVWMERYGFRGDPRLCDAPHGERAWLRLEEIAAQHPRHELWVVSTPQRFFNPTTRQPAPWVPALSRWTDRHVLSLAAASAEDREQLAVLGFTLSPVSIAGLAGLAAEIAHPSRQVPSAPYPLLLEEDESRWLEGPEPKDESGKRDLRSLNRQLRAWLGASGYRCLLSCSVYPGLAWNLTLHLALALIPAAEREQALARLVRLPWFRHGRMPLWLRAYFTDKLVAAEHAHVLALLRDFLDRKAQAQPAPTATSLEFAKREIAAELGAQGKPPTRDYVFLSFLLRRKPVLRDLEAPGWLRHILYPQGLPVLRPRRELALIAGLLLGVATWRLAERAAQARPVNAVPVWHETTPPAVRAAQPPNDLSARALEIAAAQLGQPADSMFPFGHFDRAAAFASPVGGTVKAGPRPGAIFFPGSSGTSRSLIEQQVEGGFITIEPFNGRLSRVYHPVSELRGTFGQMTEAQPSADSSSRKARR